MSKILISGYYGFGNAGDEAMLAAILEAILSVMPEAEITVISGSPQETAKKHGIKAIPRLGLIPLWKALKDCDLLISGGGSLLQDVTSKRSLYYYLTLIKLAKHLGKPVMLYAQGIGPLLRKSAQKSVGTVLNKVDLITVRDEKSKETLTALGVTIPPIIVTADAVLSMHPVDDTIGKRLLQKYNLKGTLPLIGVSVRAWKGEETYRKQLALLLDDIIEEKECHVVFIPMQFPSDYREGQAIAAHMKHEAILLDTYFTTTELLSLIGMMDLVIGVRLHALIFAALMEKPLIGISYDPKIDSFLKMIDLKSVGSLQNLDEKELATELDSYLKDKTLKKESLAKIRALRDASLQNASLAFELLDKHTHN